MSNHTPENAMTTSQSKTLTAALLSAVVLLSGCGSAAMTSQTPPPTSPPASQGFWDASSMPTAKNVMTFKFLNRTNGQFPDSHVFWSVTINGATQTHSIADQQFYDMPANASGRIYVYLGSVGTSQNNYYDFLEYTIGPA
jgi:hypothetical protein